MGSAFSTGTVEQDDPPAPPSSSHHGVISSSKKKKHPQQRPEEKKASNNNDKPSYRWLTSHINARATPRTLQHACAEFDEFDRFTFVDRTTSVTHAYNPSKFRELPHGWYVEKCDGDMTVLSLACFAPQKFGIAPVGAATYRFHVTVVRETFDRDCEFHVTIEKYAKSAKSSIVMMDKVCSDFYRAWPPGAVKAVRSRSGRPTCDHRALNQVSLAHARLFSLGVPPPKPPAGALPPTPQ